MGMSRVTPAAIAHWKVVDNLVEWGRRGNAPLERNQNPNPVSDHMNLWLCALYLRCLLKVKRPVKRAEAVLL